MAPILGYWDIRGVSCFFLLMYVVYDEHIRLSMWSFVLIDINNEMFFCGSTAS